MGKFAVGQIVSCTFPFSDLSSNKLRPAMVVASADFDDIILCQITSKPYASKFKILLQSADFKEGSLPIKSFVRPDKLFTAEPSIVSKTYGQVTSQKLSEIQSVIISLFNPSNN